MAFIPEYSVLISYTIAVIALTLTPGPDMTLFLGKTLAQGKAAGIAAYLGASSGLLVHTIIVAIGLSALISASATAFLILKIIGCVYLLYLAYDAVRNGSSFSVQQDQTSKVAVSGVFLKGLWINLLNPKIIVFFVTFFPQFVSANDPDAPYKFVFLGVMFVVVASPICLALILSADKISRFLKGSPRVLRFVDWLFATVLGAFALKLLFTKAN
ncbi:MAG: LysE family translocator [Hyphomicrobiales bacterium]